MLYALCGCSGAGKTTLLEAALQRKPDIVRLTTYTTRHPRLNEIEGQDYYFVTVPIFQEYVQSGRIVCPIEYRGSWYGTLLSDLLTSHEKDMLGIVRPDKISALMVHVPLVGIYVAMRGDELPKSSDDEVIYNHQHLCVHHITNILGDLDQTVAQLLALLEMERHK